MNFLFCFKKIRWFWKSVDIFVNNFNEFKHK